MAERVLDPGRPPDAELEPGVTDGFSLAAVGDCITAHTLTPWIERDPGFAALTDILRRATVAIGNLETSILDVRAYRGTPRIANDWWLTALPEVAGDLASLGFGLLSRANNHAMDWGVEGMRETGARLDAEGLVHAGTGDSLAHARAPRYVTTPHGRVALVSVFTTHPWDPDAALDQSGAIPGKSGVNALRVHRTITAPAAAISALREIHHRIFPDAEQTSDLNLFDTRFVEGSETLVRYDLDAEDVAANLRGIRQGKQNADLLVVFAHVHEEGDDPGTPPEHLVRFARAAIGAGADVFVGHGVHRLWPIELHRGRPIFYGLGNFVFSDIQEPMQGRLYDEYRAQVAKAFPDPSRVTDADLNLVLNATDFAGDRFFDSVIAEVSYQGGEPVVRLHPIDLRYGSRLTVSGVPRAAGPERSAAILERLDSLSASFGVSVANSDGVGTVASR